MRVLWAPGAITLGKTHRPITLLTTPFSDLAPLTGHPYSRLPAGNLIPLQTAKRQPHQNTTQENFTRHVDTSSLSITATFPEVQRKLCLHRPLGIPQTHRIQKTKRGGDCPRTDATFVQDSGKKGYPPQSCPQEVVPASESRLRTILEAVCKAAPLPT